MLMKIGNEWKGKEEGGCFSATHLSPSQINMPVDKWYYNYCVLDAEQRKKLPPNMKMIFGGIVGTAIQDMIVHKLTVKEVMKGKK